jgi:diguanylate cyclase (GGDEF)-like protein/PAS domain S-box-containing protein
MPLKISTQTLVNVFSKPRKIADMSGESDGNVNSNSSCSGFVLPQDFGSEFALNDEQLLRACIANSPVVLYGIDQDGIFTFSEGKGLEVLGLEVDEVVGKSIFELFCNYPDILANIHHAFTGEEVAWTGEFNNCVYENRTIPLLGTDNEVIGLVGIATDVTRKTQAEEELRLLAAAVEHAEDSILITSPELISPGPEIVFVNKAFTKITGYTPEDVLGQSPRILQGPKTDRTVLDRLIQTLHEGGIFYGEAINYRKNGTEFYNQWHVEPIRDSRGQITHYLGIQRDVTQRKLAEAQLRYEAFHDALTGLPNRAFFIERLHTCIERVKQCSNYLFAVLCLDLDRFKVINDSLGHKAGDKMLVAIANRLKASVQPGNTVARVGGDGFAILLENITDIGNVSTIANQLQTELQQPLQLEGQEVFTTASIGIAVSMLWYECPEDILRDADMAMYRAKALGKARSAVFNKTMYRHAVNRLQLETDLRRAIPQRELQLYYQPIVCLTTGKISGFEALVRWQHPTRGLVSPGEFIPVAEETGLILPLGEWVLREACLTAKKWQLKFSNPNPLTISVNLSGRQFGQPNLSAKIDQILCETGVERQSLKLEITESAIMENAESTGGISNGIVVASSGVVKSGRLGTASDDAIAILEQLRSLGVQLGIDDFGTGYSSLSRLYRFPINTLKIDQSFIKRMHVGSEGENCSSSCKIVRAIVMLAHNLGLDVTAEGIETPEQLTELRKLGCESGQGYFFSKPITAVEAEALLAAHPQW